ncbi:MAG: DUF4157 domain-containing protein [Acidobacteriota bacterium]
MQTKAKAASPPVGPFTLMPSHILQRKCASCGQHTVAGGGCSDCEKKEGLLQRSALSNETASEVPPLVHEVLSSSGQPLDAATRAFMEPRFGHDFSRVRVHADTRAAESARAVNALAYTVGNKVVLGEGQYAPRTIEGRRLMAHELAHTVQQSSAHYVHGAPLQVSHEDSAGEREADAAASLIDSGVAATGLSLAQLQVQRSPQTSDDIHGPVIEDYRRKHGLPPGGVDESGQRVGPSDAQIKYHQGRTAPLCPEVPPGSTGLDFRIAACSRPSPPGTPAECEFRPGQLKALRSAQSEAAGRVRRAKDRVGAGPEGRKLAGELATRLFVADAPSPATVVNILGKVGSLLSGSDVRFAGRTCADETCKIPPTVGYVTAPGQLPIFICPVAFHEPETLFRTVLHEALHWAGIVVDPRLPEIYCSEFDCQAPCGTADVADAWMHYISCLGEPLTLRRSFIPEMVKSVEDID